jgi:hypothetical protein
MATYLYYLIVSFDAVRESAHDGQGFCIQHIFGVPEAEYLMDQIKSFDGAITLIFRIILHRELAQSSRGDQDELTIFK